MAGELGKLEMILDGNAEPLTTPDGSHAWGVDTVIAATVPAERYVAAMLWLSERLGRKVGASTGTNVWGVLQVAQEMAAAGQAGSIVTLICDGGERYQDTYYHPEWVSQNIGDIAPAQAQIREWTGL